MTNIRLRAGVALLLAAGMAGCGHRPAAGPTSTVVAVISPNGVAGSPVTDPPVTSPPTTAVAAHPAPAAASRGTARRPVPVTTSTTRPAAPPPTTVVGDTSTATASWYDVAAGSGACGQKCSPYAPYTFAHRTMPFGTAVRFCVGQRCVVAHCSDRGPYIAGRTFDLSRTVFSALGNTGAGTLTVSWSFV